MNRMSFASVLFMAFLVGTSGCRDKGSATKSSDGPTGAPVGGPSGSSSEMAAGWVKVTISEGPCEVWMPGQAKRSEDVLENWGGRLYIYQVEVNKDLGYTATVSSVPTDEQAASLAVRGDSAFHLREARDRVLKDAKGKLIAEKAIDYHGHIGFELIFQDPEGFVRYQQYYITVQKHWQVFTLNIISNKREELTSKEADAFFDSFRVLKEVSPTRKDVKGADDVFRAGSVWVSDDPSVTLTVLERTGEKFRARVVVPEAEREVVGIVKDGKVTWLLKDVRRVKGGPGGDNEGTIKGDTIDFVWHDIRRRSGKFTVRLKRDS